MNQQQIKQIVINTFNFLQRQKFNMHKDTYIGRCTKIRLSDISFNVRIGSFGNVQGGKISSYTYLGDYCELPQTAIGKFCSIANHVVLAAGNHPKEFVSTSPYTYSQIQGAFTDQNLYTNEFYYTDSKKRFLCEIENDVWIGTGALLVCSNEALHIGTGAVIAAGAVVVQNVPAYAIVAGCPAKVINYRFDKRTISQLLASEWWNKEEVWIRENILQFQHPQEFLKLLE